MQFSYPDTFLTKNVEESEIEQLENESIRAISKLNITDNYYFERLVVLQVYLHLAQIRFEDGTVQKKYKLYKEEFDEILSYVKPRQTLKSVKLLRG